MDEEDSADHTKESKPRRKTKANLISKFRKKLITMNDDDIEILVQWSLNKIDKLEKNNVWPQPFIQQRSCLPSCNVG